VLNIGSGRDSEEFLRERKYLEGKMETRVGSGFDVHPLVEGRALILGGVHIDHSRGLSGHSDADVVAHAIADALLGAAALGDLGQHFPPGDPHYAGADSLMLLERVAETIRKRGWQIGNVDCTVIAEQPRISPHREAMRANLARVLGIGTECVSVKATTTERLGFTGREEGIAAQAVALIHRAT
jgi:2-C-methyl-D-erythritol 2,4-cyclodiphosphate synthase